MIYLEWPRRVAALAQFRVVDPLVPVLADADEHHLRRVLRATLDEEVVVTDGAGSWALCAVDDHGLRRVSDVHLDPSPPTTTLYFSPLKGERAEWVIAKAAEVGLTRVVPLLAERTVVKFKGEAREKSLARWRRVAAEAAGQCRRTYDLLVDDPVKVVDVPRDVALADLGASGDWSGVTSVAIGPEGGWAVGEWDDTRRRVALGPSVLRAETAAIVAASLLSFGAGDWGFTLGGTSNE